MFPEEGLYGGALHSCGCGLMAMRVILSVESPPAKGTKVWLISGQTARVGRTARADYAIADERMSGVHFALHCDASACRLRDLDSTNGTFVNGERVTEVSLRDGDTIYAGQTTFSVRLEDVAHQPETVKAPPEDARTPHDAAPSGREGRSAVQCTRTQCPSGLCLYQGHLGERSPVDIAASLAKALPLHLIVAAHLGLESASQASAPTYLYEWMSESAARLSPQIITPDDCDDLFAIVERGWGSDALVCVYSKKPASELVAQLRLAAKGQASPAQVPVEQHMFRTCQPSRLGPVLQHCTAEFANALFAALDCILFESSTGADWNLLTTEGFEGVLTNVGLAGDR